MNLGQTVEDYVEFLCTKSFLADFTFRSPKYYKSNGLEKEAADLLIIFKDTLLVIQVKTKEVDPDCGELSPVELSRIWTKIDKAIHQFRSFSEAWNNPMFKSFQNGRGIAMALDKQQITNTVLIVVFAPVWKGIPDDSTRLKIADGCIANANIPLHIFTLEDFSLLLTMLDTLPDFLIYLDARWLLHRKELVCKKTDPIDEWAFITFEGEKLIEALQKQRAIDLSGTHQKHLSSVKQLEEEEKPSYIIDRMIEWLSFSVGSKEPISRLLKNV
jgi:hypothetical protein